MDEIVKGVDRWLRKSIPDGYFDSKQMVHIALRYGSGS